jgi:flagellar hook-associated protein 1 FlgK
MSGVSAMNTALSGLAAAQRGMDTVGQNIANANTPGYSRQRVELSSVGASWAGSLHTGNGGFRGGVSVDAVRRIRDSFLASTRAAAGARRSALNARSTALAGAERLLAEPSENGVQSALDAFYASWHGAGTTPTDPNAGAVVIQQGVALANQMQAVSRGLSAQWSSSYDRLDGVIGEANQMASDLAVLHAAILRGRSVDQPVNELIDQRDQLVRTLGELVGGTALPADNGTLGDIMVVAGGHVGQLRLGGGSSIADTANPPTVMWGNLSVPVESGVAAGLLAVLRTDIPAVSADVDGVAVALRDAVNLLHNAGYTIDGSPGGDFFSSTGAGDLAVVPTAGSQIAVSAVPGDADGSNAQAIADLSLDANVASVLSPLGGGAGPSVRWREATSGLGVKVQGLSRAAAVQESVVGSAADAVEADAGVNLDEEMTNLLLWQRAYQAAARMITAADEMLDTLVNRTGLTGR